MKYKWGLPLMLAASFHFAHAFEDALDNSKKSNCFGMWGPSSIPGASKNGSITLSFTELLPPIRFAVLVYNYEDERHLRNRTTGLAMLCDSTSLQQGLCSANDTKPFIVQDHDAFISPLMDIAVNFSIVPKDIQTLKYDVYQTGLYCVVVDPTSGDLESLNVENPYGKLRGIEYPKLPFFGITSLVYLALGLAWFIKSWMHWKDILMLQHYITAVLFFLMTEMAFNYEYYQDFNRTGRSSKALLIIVVLLNSARNSISFFMLLIVSLGYGVVKPTLGSTMKKCLFITYVHFVFGVLYASGAMLVTEVTPLLALVFVLPLSTAMTIFYVLILQGLTDTVNTLLSKRQTVKLQMYQRLQAILIFSALSLLVFFSVNIFYFSKRNDAIWLPFSLENTAGFFLTDGWLNILYLIVFVSIALLWRPTENNERYGLDQLATDDYEDELERGFDGNSLAPREGIKLRNVSRNPDDMADDISSQHENEEDLFKWAEQNAPDDSSTTMERDMSDAILSSIDDDANLVSSKNQ
ncbi:lung seven transmembrane receptor-domain-containing protein [Chytridium lagenaria]|nr:lung seven transmembrane receptor-domain-containing protein [Chytridium lagenaria]